jgi:hypothetical protein
LVVFFGGGRKRACVFELCFGKRGKRRNEKDDAANKRSDKQNKNKNKNSPKVADLHERPRRAVQKRILQLDVPVDHAHAVAVVQPHDQLLEEPPRLVLAEAVFPDHVLKHVPAGRELHGDAQVLLGEEDLLELDDVGVDEAAVVDDLALDVLGDLFFFF